MRSVSFIDDKINWDAYHVQKVQGYKIDFRKTHARITVIANHASVADAAKIILWTASALMLIQSLHITLESYSEKGKIFGQPTWEKHDCCSQCKIHLKIHQNLQSGQNSP